MCNLFPVYGICARCMVSSSNERFKSAMERSRSQAHSFSRLTMMLFAPAKSVGMPETCLKIRKQLWAAVFVPYNLTTINEYQQYSLLRRPQLYSNSLLPVFFPVFANHHPTLRGVFPCARFWRSQERLFSNLVRSLLSMRCMLLGYNFEPRPRSCALGTARSVMTIC